MFSVCLSQGLHASFFYTCLTLKRLFSGESLFVLKRCHLEITMEKDPERIEKGKQAVDSEGTSSQLTPRRSIRSPTSELPLSKKYRICSIVKFICKTRTREKLILCADLLAYQTLQMLTQ